MNSNSNDKVAVTSTRSTNMKTGMNLRDSERVSSHVRSGYSEATPLPPKKAISGMAILDLTINKGPIAKVPLLNINKKGETVLNTSNKMHHVGGATQLRKRVYNNKPRNTLTPYVPAYLKPNRVKQVVRNPTADSLKNAKLIGCTPTFKSKKPKVVAMRVETPAPLTENHWMSFQSSDSDDEEPINEVSLISAYQMDDFLDIAPKVAHKIKRVMKEKPVWDVPPIGGRVKRSSNTKPDITGLCVQIRKFDTNNLQHCWMNPRFAATPNLNIFGLAADIEGYIDEYAADNSMYNVVHNYKLLKKTSVIVKPGYLHAILAEGYTRSYERRYQVNPYHYIKPLRHVLERPYKFPVDTLAKQCRILLARDAFLLHTELLSDQNSDFRYAIKESTARTYSLMIDHTILNHMKNTYHQGFTTLYDQSAGSRHYYPEIACVKHRLHDGPIVAHVGDIPTCDIDAIYKDEDVPYYEFVDCTNTNVQELIAADVESKQAHGGVLSSAVSAAAGIASYAGDAAGYVRTRAVNAASDFCADTAKSVLTKAMKFNYYNKLSENKLTRLTLLLAEAVTDITTLTLRKMVFYALRVATEFGLGFHSISDLVSSMTNILSPAHTHKGDTVVAHFGDISNIAKAVFNFFCTIFKFPTTVISMATFVNKCKDFNVVSRTFNTVSEWMKGMIEHLPYLVRNFFRIVRPESYWKHHTSETGYVRKMLGLVDMATNLEDLNQHIPPELFLEFTEQYNRYTNDSISVGFVPISVANTVRSAHKVISEIKVRSIDKTQEPFCVWLSGESGIGKTTFSRFLAQVTLGCNASDVDSLVYTRNPGTETWDGYTHQAVVIYDDFLQNRDELDAAEFINVISSARYRLPMASIDPNSKGTKGMNLSSKFVFVNSNLHAPKAMTSVNCSEAVLRRRHILVSCLQKRDSAGQAVPFKSDFSHIVFKVCDSITGIPKFSCEVSSFLNYFRDQFNKHTTLNNDKCVYADQLAAKLVPEGGLFRKKVTPQFGTWLHPSMAAALNASLGSALFAFMGFKISCTFVGLIMGYYDEMSCPLKAILIGVGALCAGISIYSLFIPTEVTAHVSGDEKTANLKRIKVIPHLSIDDNITSLERDMMVISVTDRGHSWSMNALPIEGRIAMTLQHMFLNPFTGDELTDGCPITISCPRFTDHTVFTYNQNSVFPVLNNDGTRKDVVLFDMTTKIPSFRSRTGYFVDENRLEGIVGSLAVKVTHDRKRVQVHAMRIKPYSTVEYHVGPDGQATLFEHMDAITYELTCKQGDCGSPIILDSDLKDNRIVGVHCAGSKSYGYAILVTKQQVIAALRNYSKQVIPHVYATASEPEDIPLPGVFARIGTVAPNETVHNPTKTSIIESPLYEALTPHITEPVPLHDKDRRMDMPRDLYLQGIEKYGHGNSQNFDDALVQECADSIAEEFNSYESSAVPRLLSDHETINGNKDIPFVDAMYMATSAGYPYKLTMNGPKRTLFAGDEGNYVISDVVLRNNYEERIAKGGNLQRVSTIWTPTLKDERRKLAKVVAGKARVFTIGPVDLTMVTRKYLQMFLAHIHQTRAKHFVAVGMDPYSTEWNDLVRRMHHFCLGFDGDYEDWDGRSKLQCMMAAMTIAESWYKKSSTWTQYDENVRRTLGEDTFQAVLLFKNQLIGLFGSMPSGTALTADFNSLTGEILLRVTYMSLAPLQYRSIACYRKFVRTVVYGDDNWVSADVLALDFFNLQTMSQFLGFYGIKYGAALKDGTLVKYKPVLECSFLKNTIVKRGLFYFPLLSRDTIDEMVNWIRKCDNHVKAVEDNINCALRYMYFYGRDTFDKFRTDNILAARRLGIFLSLETYNFFDRHFLQYGSLPDGDNLMHTIRRNNDIENTTILNFLTQMNPTSKTADVTIDMHKLRITAEAHSGPGLDAKVLDTENRQGVTLTEQETVETVKATEGKVNETSKRAASHIAEPPWNLESMVSRFNYVTSVDWTTTQAPLTVLSTFKIPEDLLTCAIAATPFARFTFFHGKCTIRMRIVASRFHQGRAIAFFSPLSTTTYVTAMHTPFVSAMTSLQHVILDPANGSVVDMEIPFLHYKGQISLLNNDSLGLLTVSVLNQLYAATSSSTTIQIHIYAHVDGAEFKVPVPSCTSFSAMKREAEVERAYVKATAHSGIFDVLAPFAGIIEKIIPGHLVEDAIDIFSTLDKPTNPVHPIPTVRRSEQYYANCNNVDSLQKMNLYPSAMNMSDEEHFATKQDEMDIGYLVKKPTMYFHAIPWTTTSPANTILATGPCGPGISLSNFDLDTNACPLLIDYVSSMFTYWRGAMKLRIDVVASQFHEGSLVFCYHPALQDPPADYATAISQYHAIFAIKNGKSTFTATLPYLSDTPWKKIYNGGPFSTLDQPFFNEMFTGTWTLRVAVPLKVTSAIVPNVDMNIFFSGADDFEVSFVSQWNASVIPFFIGETDKKGKKVVRAIAHSGAVEPDKQNDPAQQSSERSATVLAPVRSKIQKHNGAQHFEEQYRSLRDICKRYQFLTSGAEDLPHETPDLPFTKRIDIAEIFRSDIGGSITTIAAMYRMFRGPVRFKIVARVENAAVLASVQFRGLVQHIPANSTGVPADVTYLFPSYRIGSAGYLAYQVGNSPPIATFNEQCSAEFEIPFLSLYNAILVSHQPNEVYTGVDWGSLGQLAFAIYYPPFATRVFYEIYFSFGDESRFGCFMGTPPVFINYFTAQPSQIVWPDKYQGSFAKRK